MADNPIRRCSKSLAVRVIQISTTMRSHYTHVRMTKIKHSDNTMLVRMWKNWITHSLLVGKYNGTATLQKVSQFLKELRDPEIALLGVHPEERKMYIHTKTCAQVFIGTLYIIAQNWKQLGCSPKGHRPWCVQAMECCSAVKRMNCWCSQQPVTLQRVPLSEESQF